MGTTDHKDHMELAFHFHHVDRHLFFPHSENFKICDNTLFGRENMGVILWKLKAREKRTPTTIEQDGRGHMHSQ